MHRAIPGLACALVLAPLLLTPQPSTAEDLNGAGSVSERPQPRKNRTIAVVGDSLGDGLWGGLSVLLRPKRDIKVKRLAKNSVGFARDNLTKQVDRAFKSGSVDALVVMVGGNDDRQTIFVMGRPVALFGTPEWSKLYSARVGRYMEYICAKKVPIVWVLLPIMRTEKASAAAKLVNGIIQEAAKSFPQISLVSTREFTADANGAYMPYFKDLHGKKRLMRTSDGMHFTNAGEEVLADRVWKRLQEIAPGFRALAVSDSKKP